MIRLKPILNVIGVMTLVCGVLMATTIPFSLYYHTGHVLEIGLACFLTITAGLLMKFYKRKEKVTINKREGYITVTFGWFIMVFFCMLPYLFTHTIPNVEDAIFEVASGMTTTGASILSEIEAMPKDILYWRSMTQWIGGMGIIVLTVALFPMLRLGGNELFGAEAPGPTSDKIHPRIKETARILWFLYMCITGLLFLILMLCGMSAFDAINHAFTTMATGGFSTYNDSAMSFSPAIQYVLTFFMFIAGTNYIVIYLGITGNLKKVFSNDEFLLYLKIIFVLIVAFTITNAIHLDHSIELAFRESSFQILSLLTTTGYVSADYIQWNQALVFLCFLLLFVGGCAGSTSGGIKVIRHLVFVRNCMNEFKRILHPRAIIPLCINKAAVQPKIRMHIQVFLLLFFAIYFISCLILIMMGVDFDTSLGAVATSLGNVGPGIGKVGPTDNFGWMAPQVKVFLSFIMIVGRLELFTVLILFTPYFWREY